MVLYTESVEAGDRWMEVPDWFYLRYGAKGGADSVTYRCSRMHTFTKLPIDKGSWLLVTRVDGDRGVITVLELWQAGIMLKHEVVLHGALLPCYSF